MKRLRRLSVLIAGGLTVASCSSPTTTMETGDDRDASPPTLPAEQVLFAGTTDCATSNGIQMQFLAQDVLRKWESWSVVEDVPADRSELGLAAERELASSELTAMQDLARASQHLAVSDDEPELSIIAAAVDSEGDFAFVGNCLQQASANMRAFAITRGVEGSALWARMIDDPPALADELEKFEFEELPELRQGPDWIDLDPERRSLVANDVDPEVFAKHDLVILQIAVPERWRESSLMLCTRTTQGWSPCFQLNNEAVYADDGTVELQSLGIPGEEVEVFLADPQQGFDSATRVVGSFGVEEAERSLLDVSVAPAAADRVPELRAADDHAVLDFVAPAGD